MTTSRFLLWTFSIVITLLACITSLSGCGKVWVRLNMRNGGGGGTLSRELDASWTPQWSNIVGYWKLNEASGTGTAADSSPIGANSCTVSGGVTQGVSGLWGTAASFDGSTGCLSCGTDSSVNLTGPITVSAWVKTSGTGIFQILIGKYGPSNPWPGYSFGVGDATAGYVGFFRDPMYWKGSTNTVNDGTWHFIAASAPGSGLTGTLYVDGVANGTFTDNTNANNSTQVLTLGCGSNGYYFSGSVQELALWNTALTSTQIQTIYNRQSGH